MPTTRCFTTAVLALGLLGSAMAEKPPLRIATGELPPYATEHRPDKGIALSIVRRSFELSGYAVEYTFLPWSRALGETKSGRWDGTAYWGHKPEHQASFLLSDNVLTEQWVMVYRKELKLDWKEPADLKPYRIGMVPDYTYTPKLWEMANGNELKATRVPDDRGALQMLSMDRLDVVPMERNVACDLLRLHFTPAQAAQLSVHPRLMTDTFTTHLMLPRNRPESPVLLADFNAGLKKLRASGEYSKLLAQVQCPNGWSQADAKNPSPMKK